MTDVTKEELEGAYIKLKTHIYYDTTELFQRRKLADFEKNPDSIGKLDDLADAINGHNASKTFQKYLDNIDCIYLPKKFSQPKTDETFLTNRRVDDTYEVERVTVFADIAIELHLVTILWLMKYGYKLDRKLDKSCVGNRLILDKKNKEIVKGGGLFKPYFTQYQKWRDQSVEEAQRKLKNGSSVAIVNLDLRNYFYSVQLNFKEIEEVIFESNYEGNCNIHEIFKEFHFRFTEILAQKNFLERKVTESKSVDIDKVVLPIGVASSYVLGNYYLSDFDNRVKNLIPQVYYSRYVDDILIVIDDPDFDFHKNESCDSVKFNFTKHKEKHGVSFAKSEDDYRNDDIVTKAERFVLETFYPLVKLIDYPTHLRSNHKGSENTKNKDPKKIFIISCLEGAYFQGEKTLLYYFDHRESTAAIDKLKQELEARSSEFRDFPEDGLGSGSFDEQAYHLIFDGTEGKVRTLKDYKENRYGLSVFLANRIFSTLRGAKENKKDERDKLLRLFMGLNNLEHYRLWEKILTFFLVCDDKDGFIKFYKHTLEEILKLDSDEEIQKSKITNHDVAESLKEYLDISMELTLALSPEFIRYGTKSYRILTSLHADFERDAFFGENPYFILPGSPEITRFRTSNMIRHHYVAHPLLNYMEASDEPGLNLVARNLPESKRLIEKLKFCETKIKYTPRQVKFWECCIAVTTNILLRKFKNYFIGESGRHQYTRIFSEHENSNDDIGNKFILKLAFEKYEEINEVQFQANKPSINDFFKKQSTTIDPANNEDEVLINEIHINSTKKLDKKPTISIANTRVHEHDIEASIKRKPNFNAKRYSTFAGLLKASRKEGADIMVLPEFSVPYEFVASLAKYSEKNEMAIVAGLEHWNVNNTCYNFIVSIMPVEVNGIQDAVVLYRLKNHYAHIEEMIIRGYGYNVPKPKPYRYDLINWRNLYFSTLYCFELADTFHRSLFRSKVDLLILSEWNKDTPYFSNIVEALSRDLHCYVAQVNTSQYGDSRLTQPAETALKDLMKLKGGKNNTVIVEEMDLYTLRNFQLKYFELSKADSRNIFKPLPPDWNRKDVNRRIDNAFIFAKDESENSSE